MNAAPHLSTLGRYTTILSLGQGGMANISLAVMSDAAREPRLLVLKALREDLETSAEDMVGMFVDEARLAARLNHRNIVHTLEFGEIDGHHFIAMEYLEGQPLRTVQRLFGHAALPLAEELRILAETARGLHHAHELTGYEGEPLEVVHRDVSPHNVMVTYDGQVKLLDFGIAKTAASEHLTKVGVIKGKVDYIAPEQVRGEKVDRRADVFALGVMLWEAITGERFAGGPTVPDVTKIHNRLHGAEPKLRKVRPDVPEPLARIVDEAIALDPAARMRTAGAFAERIEAYLASLPAQPSAQSLAALIGPRFAEERAKMQRAIAQQLHRLGEIGSAPSSPPVVASTGTQRAFASGLVELTAPRNEAEPAPAPYATAAVPETAPWNARTRIVSTLAVVAVGVFAVLATRNDRPTASASAAPTEPPAVVAPSVEAAGPTAPEPRESVAPGSTTTAPASAAVAEPVPSAPVAVVAAPAPAEPSTPAERVEPRREAREPERKASTVQLSIGVTPTGARVTLDGTPLPSPPFTTPVAKSAEVHRLEASADGYRTIHRMVVLDRDRRLDLALEAEPAHRHGEREKTPRHHHADEEVAKPAKPPVASNAKAEPSRTKPPASPVERRAPKVERPSRPKPGGFDMTDPYAE